MLAWGIEQRFNVGFLGSLISNIAFHFDPVPIWAQKSTFRIQEWWKLIRLKNWMNYLFGSRGGGRSLILKITSDFWFEPQYGTQIQHFPHNYKTDQRRKFEPLQWMGSGKCTGKLGKPWTNRCRPITSLLHGIQGVPRIYPQKSQKTKKLKTISTKNFKTLQKNNLSYSRAQNKKVK